MTSDIDGPDATASHGRRSTITTILASASQRRIALLASLGVRADAIAADVDESVLPGETGEDYVVRVATDKAHAVSQAHPEAVVIAADTSVVVDGEIIGKPVDHSDAKTILGVLAGRDHRVLTAVVVIDRHGIEHSALSSTDVHFADLTDSEIDWYIATGEPFGKAGAYAIQGVGEFMVESINGSPSTVSGLPLRATIELLRAADIEFPVVDSH